MARQSSVRKRTATVRLSISFSAEQHRELRALADRHDPPLSIQYLVQHAVKNLLKSASDPQMRLVFVTKRGEKP
jgi:hypothetical protein